MSSVLYDLSEVYLIKENPPIIGKTFISPLAALIIPIIAITKSASDPSGKIINQPRIGIIVPTILTATAANNKFNC